MLLHKLHQYLHHFGISERPGFDGVDGRILGKALQLLFDQVRADGLGTIYVAGVLHVRQVSTGSGWAPMDVMACMSACMPAPPDGSSPESTSTWGRVKLLMADLLRMV